MKSLQNFIPDEFLSKEADFEKPGAASARFCVVFFLLMYICGVTALKYVYDNGYLQIEIEVQDELQK